MAYTPIKNNQRNCKVKLGVKSVFFDIFQIEIFKMTNVSFMKFPSAIF